MRDLIPFDNSFDDMFDNVFDSLKNQMLNTFDSKGSFKNFVSKSSFPKVNVLERGNDVVFEVALPGYHPEDLSVTLVDGTLEISGKAVNDNNGDDVSYIHRGVSKKAFTTSFKLPENTKEDQITSEYDKGILTITAKNVIDKENKKTESKRIPISFKKKESK